MLKRLRLKDFRSFSHYDVSFEPKVNWIIGPNAVGKTNLLEAIHLVSTGRSFRTPYLRELIRHGAESFTIEATFEKEGFEHLITIHYNDKKRLCRINNTEYGHFSPLLGHLPSTLLSPKAIELITGSPLERRRYLNIQIAQVDPLYVHHLMRYTRALKQRNALLKAQSVTSIEPFEHEMARSADILMKKRDQAIALINTEARAALGSLSTKGETIALNYKPSLPLDGDLTKTLATMRHRELKARISLYGPHRDDFEIHLNDKVAKSFGSEGQKRTVAAALKFAEWGVMEKKMGGALFCCDDFGVQLDKQRTEALASALSAFDQALVTAPYETGLVGHEIKLA